MTDQPCGCTTADDRKTWTVVRWSHAQQPQGRCALHGCAILKGEPIAKLWDGQPGHQTSRGQGPGIWVCADCARAHATD